MDQDRLEFNQALLKAARRVDPDFAKSEEEIRRDKALYGFWESRAGTIFASKKLELVKFLLEKPETKNNE